MDGGKRKGVGKGVGEILEEVNGWQREENGKGVQRWQGWGKVRLGTGVMKNFGEGRGKEGQEVTYV